MAFAPFLTPKSTSKNAFRLKKQKVLNFLALRSFGGKNDVVFRRNAHFSLAFRLKTSRRPKSYASGRDSSTAVRTTENLLQLSRALSRASASNGIAKESVAMTLLAANGAATIRSLNARFTREGRSRYSLLSPRNKSSSDFCARLPLRNNQSIDHQVDRTKIVAALNRSVRGDLAIGLDHPTDRLTLRF